MAEYPGFKHGTRAEIDANGFSTAGNGESLQAIVYIGTAPVHLIEDGAKNVNKPILVQFTGTSAASVNSVAGTYVR